MAMTLITTNTSSNAASSSFTSGIDSTYKLYIFKFLDINAETDAVNFTFQVNATDGADYNDSPLTTTYFMAEHYEDDSGTPALVYKTALDLGNAASFQPLAQGLGNGADESCAGTMWLFNPSQTTYVKHFYSTFTNNNYANLMIQSFVGGYINDTTAIDDIQFKMSSDNFDGTIKMYGVG